VGIDGRRQLAATAYSVHTFFDVYLRGMAAVQALTSPLYPEIESVDRLPLPHGAEKKSRYLQCREKHFGVLLFEAGLTWVYEPMHGCCGGSEG
jgi:hypothetical protein